jgi:hypothetical protein
MAGQGPFLCRRGQVDEAHPHRLGQTQRSGASRRRREAYLASLIRSASTHTQVLLSTQSATLVDHFKPSDVAVTEMHEGASTFDSMRESSVTG